MVFPILMVRPDGSRDKNGPVTLTRSGATYDTTLDGSPAWRVLEGTTNLLINPIGAINTSGWSVSTGGTTLTQDVTVGHNYGTSFKAICDGASSSQGIVSSNGQVAASLGLAYTYSVWVKSSVNVTVYVNIQERDASTTLGTYNTGVISLVAGEWNQLTITRTTANAGVTQIRCGVWTNVAQSVTLWTTEHQLEQKSSPTPFCPEYDTNGVILPAQTWNGTPHASTSTRTQGVLSTNALSLQPRDKGGVYTRFRVWTPNNGVRPFSIFKDGVSFSLDHRGSAHTYMLSPASGARNDSGYIDGTTLSYYGGWDGTSAWTRDFGGSLILSPITGMTGSWPTSTTLNFGVGGRYTNGWTVIQLWYDRPLSSAELAKLDATPTSELGWNTLVPTLGSVIRTKFQEPIVTTRS